MLSGPNWCSKFPTSVSLSDLIEPFQTNCKNFISALESAGAKISISATYRPVERAWLMHYAAALSEGLIQPSAIPIHSNIDIQWNHGNLLDSKTAALQMAKGYGIVYPPALESRHTQRLAVDMWITWPPVSITLSDGTTISDNTSLFAAGEKFGVIKFKYGNDAPHWSNDGH